MTTPPTPPSPTPLTEESEALLARDMHCGIRSELAAIEAAAIARHVRETGCEGGFTDDHEVCDQQAKGLRERIKDITNAADAYVDAVNGRGHEGTKHDRDLWHPMPGDVQVYSTVGDCAGCGGAQYGTEYELQVAYVAGKLVAGLPLRPYEEQNVEQARDLIARAALAADASASDAPKEEAR